MLLIASNAPDELTLDRAYLTLDRAYRRRIGGNARLWSVPDASDTKALERHPAAYSGRVAAFLNGP